MTTTDKANKLLLIITKPEVRKFVNAQKRKDTRTVEQMYFELLRKEKRKNKKSPNSWGADKTSHSLN